MKNMRGMPCDSTVFLKRPLCIAVIAFNTEESTSTHNFSVIVFTFRFLLNFIDVSRLENFLPGAYVSSTRLAVDHANPSRVDH